MTLLRENNFYLHRFWKNKFGSVALRRDATRDGTPRSAGSEWNSQQQDRTAVIITDKQTNFGNENSRFSLSRQSPLLLFLPISAPLVANRLPLVPQGARAPRSLLIFPFMVFMTQHAQGYIPFMPGVLYVEHN